MSQTLQILMVQMNPLVGAIASNTKKIIDMIIKHQAQHDVIVFPELALSGYPPEDLLLQPAFYQQMDEALEAIQVATEDCYVIVGHPCIEKQGHYNAASVFFEKNRMLHYHKQHLPNYDVFDEKRYFLPGEAKPCILSIKGYQFGICICEDIWRNGPFQQLLKANVDGFFCLNASPFDYKKHDARVELLKALSQQGVSIFYVNQVGGQDELVFDGDSMAFNGHGELCARLPVFEETAQTVTFCQQTIVGNVAPFPSEEKRIYDALVCGTRDYVEKNGFPGVLLGLSGGIDSALTLSIAVDALGASRVHAVMMPSRYTAEISLEDAKTQLRHLGVDSTLISIEPLFNAFLEALAPSFVKDKPDVTEQNIQARIRCVLLMALSNKTGKMVLTTSNKSETAVGYTTLYGDMAGGFAVLKDVLKTQVYALARYRNTITPIIPERVLTRPPSAELAENQTDQDSLPEYVILDSIIEASIEKSWDADTIIAAGHRPDDVYQTIRLIKQNEYKRRQAPLGIKISSRAFGRDWRMPITSGFE